MKTLIVCGIFLACLVQPIVGTLCDPNSDTNACADQEVCRVDTCETSVACDNDRECAAITGDVCVDYLCQPEFCAFQGQCAGADWYQCSNDTTRRCVDTWQREGRVGREARIYFGIVPFDSYVMWYKGSRDASDLIITKDTMTGVTRYFNDWCDGATSCDSSTKGEILSYGWLRMFNITPEDEGYYFWNQNYTFSKVDPGYDYQVYFTVNDASCNVDDNTACWWDEICRGGQCVLADRCTNNNDSECLQPGEACVSTYCQLEFCQGDGDCARYKVCSNDTIQRCVRSQFVFGREDRERRLFMPDWEPFSEVRWYKGNRDNLILLSNVNETIFYGDLCDGPSPCNATTRARLEDDGDLTLLNLVLNDQDIYFYNLNTTNGKDDPGFDFQLNVTVIENKCNMSIDDNQCYWDEICRDDTCVTATKCDSNVNCTRTGEVCVSQFCMPELCTADNQCAAYYSYRCSEDSPEQRCVRSSYYFSQREGTQGRLTLPVTLPFTNVTWYKNNRGTGKIAERDMDAGTVEYYGSFCNGTSPCATSSRGELDSGGALVIYSAQLTDTDNYFYNLGTDDPAEDPGLDYQLLLRVYADWSPSAPCTGDFSASSGSLLSPNYPSADYRNYLNCQWSVNIPMAAAISWQFDQFDLEECCECDFVEITDTDGKILYKFCQGNTTAGTEYSTPNDVRIRFYTDWTINRPGFQLNWNQDGTVTTVPNTTAAVTTTAGPPPSTTAGPPPSTTAGPPPSTTAGPPPSTTAGPPPTTTAGPPPSTTAGPPPTTTTEEVTTENGGMSITPEKLNLIVATVLFLVFRW